MRQSDELPDGYESSDMSFRRDVKIPDYVLKDMETRKGTTDTPWQGDCRKSKSLADLEKRLATDYSKPTRFSELMELYPEHKPDVLRDMVQRLEAAKKIRFIRDGKDTLIYAF